MALMSSSSRLRARVAQNKAAILVPQSIATWQTFHELDDLRMGSDVTNDALDIQDIPISPSMRALMLVQ